MRLHWVLIGFLAAGCAGQHRGDALGFVRSAALEQYLNETRRRLVAASGKTGVPGRVVILANPGFEAFS
ncbi:MAG TPA: hypothetical protein VFZ82_01055, partial [Methylomirabilota bacterium]|nr:hypothetical protein [Methylomirabilota bacterium]